MNIDQKDHLEQSPENLQASIDKKIDAIGMKYLGTYKLSNDTIKQLTTFSTNKEVLAFRDQISNSHDKEKLQSLSEENFQEFMQDFSQITNETKTLKDQLKNEIISNSESSESNNTPTDNFLTSILGESVFNKLQFTASNPTKPHHHVNGAVLALTQSSITTLYYTAKVLLDTGKTPYHLYQYAKGDIEIKNFRNV